jgi:hypothetical protein
MARPIWVALVFLMGICAWAAVLKVGIVTPPKQPAAFSDEVPENALAKADKLDVEEIPDKKTIRSIAIVPPIAAPKPEKATKIISRHWQNAKAKLRKYHHRHVSGKTRRLKAKGK